MPNDREVGTEEIVYPTTITLVADPHDKIKMFFCFNCQSPLLQYKGNVININAGLPVLEPYTILKCKNHRCPMAFCFSPLLQMSSKYVL